MAMKPPPPPPPGYELGGPPAYMPRKLPPTGTASASASITLGGICRASPYGAALIGGLCGLAVSLATWVLAQLLNWLG